MIKTIGYSPDNSGWSSFYSFFADYMIGMNNNFYTFKHGNLYIHNSNSVRNNFYGVQYTSTIRTVFNDAPTEPKLFRTLGIVGDEGWAATVETDVQDNAYIEQDWFVKKEGNYFAYLRSTNTVPALSGEYPLRSVTGIGSSLTVSTGTPSAKIIGFSIDPLISIGNIISIGDYLYFTTAGVPVYCGLITDVVQNYRANQNYIQVDTTVVGGHVPPTNNEFFMFIKNQVAESLGILGNYAIVDLENDSTTKVEIFALNSEVQKSYP